MGSEPIAKKHSIQERPTNQMNNSTTGFDECVGITRFIAKLTGVWPELEEKKSFVARYHFAFPASLILFLLIIPQSRRAIIYRKDLNEVVELLSTGIVMEAIALWKLLGFRYNQAGLRELILIIAEDWKTSTEKEKAVMWKYAKLSNLIVGSCLALTVGDVLAQIVRVPVVYYIEIHNAAENETIPKPFFLKSDFYFELQKSPVHELVYSCQILACSFVTFCFTSCDGFFVFSILHFSGQFQNLQEKIECLVDKQVEDKCSFMDVLVPVIDRHRHLCRYTSAIEDNFNKIFLFQMLATSVLLCLQGYEFASVFAKSGAEMLAHLMFIACFVISIIVSILMYCYVAETLRVQSEQLFHSIFNIEWYELPPNQSKLLIIIMNRTKSPIGITVGKFVAFSLEYFCSVIKTSAGYLSVLLAMKDKL